MVGAFESRKDYPSFIAIANQILSERKDVVFMALGGGSMLEECKGLVNPQYKDRMIFTGNIPDVESVIQLFTIGVLISNTLVHGEGISNAIMEYMAAGKPVLANDNGGNKEIILHEKTGYILDSTNSKSWGAKINYLLDQPEIAEKMGCAGRNRIASTFEMGKMTSRFVELYGSLMRKSEKMSKIWAQDQ
jgi:glycosyltransferase involved in cell wall biosynthesis